MKSIITILVIALFPIIGCNPSENKQTSVTSAVQEKENSNNDKIELLDTYWKVVELNGQAVVNPPANQNEAYIIFSKEGSRIVGSSGCNAMTGSFTLLDDNRITFSAIASTKMGCPDMAIENQIGKAIEMTDNYSINGNMLFFQKGQMAPHAKFEAQPSKH